MSPLVVAARAPRKLGRFEQAGLTTNSYPLSAVGIQLTFFGLNSDSRKSAPNSNEGEATMQYRKLGQTGMTVSRICLGCMSYGSTSWRPWVLTEDAAQPFFKQALDLGINFFDTADMYSLGVSEEITGKMLRAMARLDEIVL